MKTLSLYASLPLILIALLPPAANGQRAYTVPGSQLEENFSALNPSFQGGAAHPWTDDATVPGWYSNMTQYYSNANPAETSRLYNLRAASDSTDQTLGSVPGGSSGDIHKALRLVNETGRTLTSLSIAYDGQQWRKTANEIAGELTVSYRLGGTTLAGGAWEDFPGLTFTALHTGGSAINLNGNLPENSARLSAETGNGFSWEPGEELWIRWTHANHSGTNHALGLDNVAISAVAPFSSAGSRGGWLWQTSDHPYGSNSIIGDPGRENEAIALFASWEMGRLYTSIGPARLQNELHVIRSWNAKLHHNGIEPHLLFSSTSWLEPPNWTDMRNAIQGRFIDFNQSAGGEAERFAGIHFDIEPQAHPNWSSYNAAERREALEDMILMIEDARSYLNDNGAAGAYFSCAIPHWYDRLPPSLGGTGTIGWTSVADRDGWFARLSQAVDTAVVMAFNLGGSGPVLASTEWLRTEYPGELRLSLRVDGPEWSSIGEMIATLLELEEATGLGVDVHPLYRFAELTLWRLRPTYADWRAASFDETAQLDDGVSGPQAKPAGDGVANALKYALGLGAAPATPGLLPAFDFQEVDGEGLFSALRFRRLVEAQDLTYTVQASGNLTHWEPLSSGEIYRIGPAGAGAEEVVAVDETGVPGSDRRFLRLRVDLSAGPALDYRQDFDSLDPTFTDIYGEGYPWIDDETIPGWFTNLPRYFATANPIEGNRLFNLRAGSSSVNQSLGSVPGGSSGDIHKAKRLVNESGLAIHSLQIGYTGEQWRNSGNAAATALTVSYRIGGGTIDDGEWTAIPELTFSAPQTDGAAQNIDGKTGSNRHSLSHALDNIVWPAGEELWVRWTHANHASTNHALSIDDVSVRGWSDDL